MSAPSTRADAGFTLVELLVVITLMSVIMGFAVGGWRSYAAAREQNGTGQQVRETLRQAQQQAVTEGTSICVDFATTTFQTFRGACDSGSKVAMGAARPLPRGLSFSSAAFTTAPSVNVAGVTFRSRGSATPGSVKLMRTGSSTTTTISVEGLTGRVAIS